MPRSGDQRKARSVPFAASCLFEGGGEQFIRLRNEEKGKERSKGRKERKGAREEKSSKRKREGSKRTDPSCVDSGTRL